MSEATSRLFPLGEFILARRAEAEEKTQSGLYIPDSGKERPSEGFVERVGDRVQTKFRFGDNILFGKYAGTEVTVDGEELLLLREEEIIGILAARKAE